MATAVIVRPVKSGGCRVMWKETWTGRTGTDHLDRWPGQTWVQDWQVPWDVALELHREPHHFMDFETLEAAERWLREQGGKPPPPEPLSD